MSQILIFLENVHATLHATYSYEDALLVLEADFDTPLVEWRGVLDEDDARHRLNDMFRHTFGELIPFSVLDRA
jgi:hypothetical protein